MRFTVARRGSDPLDLRETLERFASEQWLPPRTREEAEEIVMDEIKQTIARTLANVSIKVQ
jgi:hypothetical protein